MNYESLPQEMWLHIFSFLGARELGKIQQVCHMFRLIGDDEDLWKGLCAQEYEVTEKDDEERWRDVFKAGVVQYIYNFSFYNCFRKGFKSEIL